MLFRSLMTYNFKFLSLHPTSLVKSIALKNGSLPCTPGAAITPYPIIQTNPILFSSKLGNASTLSRMSPRSTLRARFSNGGYVKQLGATLDDRLSMDERAHELSCMCFSLPQDIRLNDDISTFCRLLKTFYFRNAFDQH